MLGKGNAFLSCCHVVNAASIARARLRAARPTTNQPSLFRTLQVGGVRFRNQAHRPMKLYWVSHDGKPVMMARQHARTLTHSHSQARHGPHPCLRTGRLNLTDHRQLGCGWPHLWAGCWVIAAGRSSRKLAARSRRTMGAWGVRLSHGHAHARAQPQTSSLFAEAVFGLALC